MAIQHTVFAAILLKSVLRQAKKKNLCTMQGLYIHGWWYFILFISILVPAVTYSVILSRPYVLYLYMANYGSYTTPMLS
jgi:hypothetical protein